MVYNKKGFSFVSVYKRDIFDKYTLIYWIQESYDIIFVFFSVDSAVQNDNLKFLQKILELFGFHENFVSLHPQNRSIGLWCNGNTTDSGPVIPSSNLGSPTEKLLFTDETY